MERYANDIFSIGDEMLDTLEGRPVSGRARLRVGVADVLPKMAVARVLEPLLVGEKAAHLTCYEGKPTDLLAKLSVRELDLVLSDYPVGPDQSIRAFNHLLGECSVTVFAWQETSTAFRREFPQSLEGARFVLPTSNTALRRMLDDWFARREIHPQVIAEIEDSALVKAFAQVTGALFAAPSLISDRVATLYGAMPVGEIQEIQARFYAISLERKVKNPVVRALLDASREDVFYR